MGGVLVIDPEWEPADQRQCTATTDNDAVVLPLDGRRCLEVPRTTL